MWAGVPITTDDLKFYSPYFPQEDAERLVADLRRDPTTLHAAFAEIVGFEENRTHDADAAREWGETTIEETLAEAFDCEPTPDREAFRAFLAKALSTADRKGGER
jgi:hypothetical protein